MSNIKEKLKEIEKNMNEIEFIINYKGEQIHSAAIPVPLYAESVLRKNEATFDLFFYDMTRKLKEKIDKEHQNAFFDKQDGSGLLNDKIDKEQ